MPTAEDIKESLRKRLNTKLTVRELHDSIVAAMHSDYQNFLDNLNFEMQDFQGEVFTRATLKKIKHKRNKYFIYSKSFRSLRTIKTYIKNEIGNIHTEFTLRLPPKPITQVTIDFTTKK